MKDCNVFLVCDGKLIGAVQVSDTVRKESRGAQYRSDYPNTEVACQSATLIARAGDAYRVWLDKERAYES